LLQGIGFTWLLSLPMRGSMRTGYHIPCTVLPLVGARLDCRVLGLELFFLTWSPGFSRGSHCPRGSTCYDRQAGAQSHWIAPPCLTISHGTVQDSHHPSPRVRESWGGAPSSVGEVSSPRVLELGSRDFASVREDFLAGVIMPIMRVEGEEPLILYSRGLESRAREPSC
jgi:hypothetical protein